MLNALKQALLTTTLVVAGYSSLEPDVASADEIPNVDYVADGAIAAGATLVAYLIKRLPIETERPWRREIFGPLDELVRHNFSATADKISDFTLTTTVIAPYILTFADGFDEAARKRAVVYSQALALNLAPAAATKFFVRRPRPYTYNSHPTVRALVQEAESDNHKSFYSGHSAMSFAAAVASSTLFTGQTENREARMAAWAMQLALATGTANLRVRAGRHFYSDVFIGAFVGSSISYLVVGVHAEDGFYKPSGSELAAIGGGIALGALITQLIPLDKLPAVGEMPPVTIAPLPLEGGAGLSLLGVL